MSISRIDGSPRIERPVGFLNDTTGDKTDIHFQSFLSVLFSAGYNAWRDTKKPGVILNELCRTAKLNAPVYTSDYQSLAIGDVRFDCDPECLDFAHSGKALELAYRKVPHESPQEYIRQNTALAALHGWGRKINAVSRRSFLD